MKNIVVIPVYKEQPNEKEMASLKRCLEILRNHRICLVAPENLNLNVYKYTFETFQLSLIVETFQSHYFKNISGYNRLLLSKPFYARFAAWEYMLIYQLDAWVFRDELDDWCAKGYDYIGAPWMLPDGKIYESTLGNGGFSLRYIPAFLDVFDYKGLLWGYKGLACWFRFRGPLRKPLSIVRGFWGWRNRMEYFIENGKENEDLFFAALKYKKEKPFRIPSYEEAMYFSFEVAPALWYERTGRQLPFGCHAWEKWEYETFWKKFIKEKETKHSDLCRELPEGRAFPQG